MKQIIKLSEKWYLPKAGDLIYIFTFLISLLSFSFLLNSELLKELKSGELLLQNGFMQNDPFSWKSMGTNYFIESFGGKALYYWIYIKTGFAGLAILNTLIFSFVFTTIFTYMNKNSRKIALNCVMFIFAYYISMSHWIIAVNNLNYIFFTIYIIVLNEFYEEKSKKIYFLIPMNILWVNMASEFIFGYLLIALLLVILIFSNEVEKNKKIKEIICIFLAIILLTGINPYGYKIFLSLKDYFNIYNFERMGGWAPPNFHGYYKYANLYIAMNLFVLSIYFYFGKIKKKTKGYLFFVSLLLLFIFLYGHQNLFYFLIASLIAFANVTKNVNLKFEIKWMRKISIKLKKIEKNVIENKFCRGNNYIYLMLICIIFGSNFLKLETELKKVPKTWNRYRGIDYLKSNKIYGNIFHYDTTGDMLIWYGYPDIKVYIDSRGAMYGLKHTDKYSRILLLKKGWNDILEGENIKIVLLPKRELLMKVLNNSADWTLVFDDGSYQILLEKDYFEKIKNRININLVEQN